jgi:hypothetical protein
VIPVERINPGFSGIKIPRMNIADGNVALPVQFFQSMAYEKIWEKSQVKPSGHRNILAQEWNFVNRQGYLQKIITARAHVRFDPIRKQWRIRYTVERSPHGEDA